MRTCIIVVIALLITFVQSALAGPIVTRPKLAIKSGQEVLWANLTPDQKTLKRLMIPPVAPSVPGAKPAPVQIGTGIQLLFEKDGTPITLTSVMIEDLRFTWWILNADGTTSATNWYRKKITNFQHEGGPYALCVYTTQSRGSPTPNSPSSGPWTGQTVKNVASFYITRLDEAIGSTVIPYPKKMGGGLQLDLYIQLSVTYGGVTEQITLNESGTAFISDQYPSVTVTPACKDPEGICRVLATGPNKEFFALQQSHTCNGSDWVTVPRTALNFTALSEGHKWSLSEVTADCRFFRLIYDPYDMP